jgi:antitoxin component YwqK of YwqJK toxin-antitoxin module
VYLEFFENGQKRIYGEYVLPQVTPSFKTIIDTLHDLGEFYDHIVIKEVYDDIKNGRWIHWDSTGKIIKTEVWENGKIIRLE